MNKQQAEERIQKLRKLIDEYRYEYHVKNNSIMSEAAADGLKHELTELEEQFPELITADSPSQRVAGEPLPEFVSVDHKTRMLSLNDVFSDEEAIKWEERVHKLLGEKKKLEYFVDLKMDGFACSLVYEDGALVRAITRGDGFKGEDITQNVKTLESVPLKLRKSRKYSDFLQGRTEIRGEILMYKADFEKLNEQRTKKSLPQFKNPRNTAAGTMRQLDTSLVAERTLYFHGYDLLRSNAAEVPSYEVAYEAIKELGAKVNDKAKKFTDIKDVLEYAKYWEERRLKLPYGTDGLVVKVNDRALYKKLGVVGKAPRGAIAYKYPAEEATTKVLDIIISIGRIGTATPVAVLEPVNVAGSTVQHASLHNQDEIARKDIRVGDTVIIHKAGDIIPQVKRVLTELRDGSEKKYNMERELEKHELDFERVEGEVAWRAIKRHTPEILKRTLQHYASKQALDIEGMGEKNVNLLVDEGLVKDVADIYALTEPQVESLERFAELSAKSLIKAIAETKSPTFDRFLFGLGIRHIGQQTAIDLSQQFGAIEQLEDATFEDLMDVEGIGDTVAQSIIDWFADEYNQKLLKKFKKLGVWPKHAKKIEGPLLGKSFVITGTLDSMSRDEAAEKIRSLGGTFQTSVGTNTDYLVYGTQIGASKKAKAEKYSTKTVNEKDFLQLIKT